MAEPNLVDCLHLSPQTTVIIVSGAQHKTGLSDDRGFGLRAGLGEKRILDNLKAPNFLLCLGPCPTLCL